jgi:hypothetical protein
MTFCDTATVRGGHEGDVKKNWSELGTLYGLTNLRAAYKRDKMLGIEILVDDIAEGRLHIPGGGPFANETEKTIWTENEREEIERIINDDIYHPDMMDALLYPYRYLCSYGNSAMMGRERIEHTNRAKSSREIYEEKQEEIKAILNTDVLDMVDALMDDNY